MYEIKNLAKKTLNKKILTDFLDFTNNELKIDKPYSVYFVDDKVNAADPLGKTAMYNPSTSSVYIYATNRHFKDILRSIAHELMHHKQNCDGRLDKTDEEGSDNLMGLETEAQKAGILVRMFEDGRKEELQEQKDDSENLKLKQDLFDINKEIEKLKARQEREGKSFPEMANLQKKKDTILKKIKSTEKKEFAAQAVKAGYPNAMPSWAKKLYKDAKNKKNVIVPPTPLGMTPELDPLSDENEYQRLSALEKCAGDEKKIGAFCYPKGINIDIINRRTGYPTNYDNYTLSDVALFSKQYAKYKRGSSIGSKLLNFMSAIGEKDALYFLRKNTNNPIIALIKNYPAVKAQLAAFKNSPVPPDDYLVKQEEYIIDNIEFLRPILERTPLKKTKYKKVLDQILQIKSTGIARPMGVGLEEQNSAKNPQVKRDEAVRNKLKDQIKQIKDNAKTLKRIKSGSEPADKKFAKGEEKATQQILKKTVQDAKETIDDLAYYVKTQGRRMSLDKAKNLLKLARQGVASFYKGLAYRGLKIIDTEHLLQMIKAPDKTKKLITAGMEEAKKRPGEWISVKVGKGTKLASKSDGVSSWSKSRDVAERFSTKGVKDLMHNYRVVIKTSKGKFIDVHKTLNKHGRRALEIHQSELEVLGVGEVAFEEILIMAK